MSGEALSWNINILKLTKVKAFIRGVQTFLVRWLVSAKDSLSSLISQLNYSLLFFIAAEGWRWWGNSFSWLDKPCLSFHTILTGPVSLKLRGDDISRWFARARESSTSSVKASFNKAINDVMKTEPYYLRWCFQLLILIVCKTHAQACVLLKWLYMHTYNNHIFLVSILSSYQCTQFLFVFYGPLITTLHSPTLQTFTHPLCLSFCFVSHFLRKTRSLSSGGKHRQKVD